MRVRLVALVPVLGLVLAGCTSSAEQPPVEPPPFSATPTPTPSVVALEVPPSARATDAVGAAQFGRFYLEVLNRANVTGDVSQLRLLSHPDCSTCAEFIDSIVTEERAGKRFEGGSYRVTFAEASQVKPGDALIDLLADRDASRTTAADGTVSTIAPQRRQALQMRALRLDSGWVAYGIRNTVTPS